MQQTKSSEQINARTLFEHFREEFKNSINSVKPPSWNMKDMSLLKNLINEQGAKHSKAYVSKVFLNWKNLKEQFNLHGYPTVGLIWSFRFSFLDYKPIRKNNSVIYEPERKSNMVKRRKNKNLSPRAVFLSH